MALRTDLTTQPCAHRGAILNFRSDPGAHDDPSSFEFLEDGLLVTRGGRVDAIGPAIFAQVTTWNVFADVNLLLGY